jgi:release factor glutamine methyltransferase
VSLAQTYTGRQLFKQGVFYLKQIEDIEDGQARFEARIFLSMSWGMEGSELALSLDDAVPEQVIKAFRELIQRRCNGEPFQYLTGEAEFMEFTFRVRPEVLIPRADTETLVREALRLLPEGSAADVLELGIGSGAVLGMLAYHRPLLTGVGVDLSPQALVLAEENLRDLGVASRIELSHGSWFKPVALRRFHMIVTNPPYISMDEMKQLPRSVLMEPAMALYGGPDGLSSYREILKDAGKHLLPEGRIVMEIGWKQAADVGNMLARHGFRDIEVIQDSGGRDRVIGGRQDIGNGWERDAAPE